MTFTILGRCQATGQLGGAVTTSDIAVGARVLHARAGLAIAATQHRTDPRLGPALLDRIEAGDEPEAAIEAVTGALPAAHRRWRQLGLLDARGRTASFTGELAWPVSAELPGPDRLVLANMLTGDGVAAAIAAAFDGTAGELAGRLLAALRAGLDAGGETGALRSAAIVVVESQKFPLVDLRVDEDTDPLTRLQALWDSYRPHVAGFLARALDPDHDQRSSSTTT
jgi:uncharacterized Ntn-hydrolase superfamily protein